MDGVDIVSEDIDSIEKVSESVRESVSQSVSQSVSEATTRIKLAFCAGEERIGVHVRERRSRALHGGAHHLDAVLRVDVPLHGAHLLGGAVRAAPHTTALAGNVASHLHLVETVGSSSLLFRPGTLLQATS
jgi:hypothetical protein